MRRMRVASIDSIVTDPPYEIGFMGRTWDASGIAFRPETWEECLRVLKPGGHMLVCGFPRNYHRLACAIEDAGFEVRDCLMWLYGSGFPKSLDVSKAIDKAAGAEREVIGSHHSTRVLDAEAIKTHNFTVGVTASAGEIDITTPATPEAQQWQGWGTALKPAYEPILLARKPLDGTVAANVLAHGVGSVNIDDCRVGWEDGPPKIGTPGWGGPAKKLTVAPGTDGATVERMPPSPLGRWPANVILDEEAGRALDEQSGISRSTGGSGSRTGLVAGDVYGSYSGKNRGTNVGGLGDVGGASRFFYCPKAGRAERDAGMEGDERAYSARANGFSSKLSDTKRQRANHHPTVKPLRLMQYLCRLITPPDGVVLDPFMGSGSTGVAALAEGFRFVGIERDPEYLGIARRRTAGARARARAGTAHAKPAPCRH